MRTRWSPPILGGLCILGLAACATAAAPAGVGGEPIGSSSPGGASPMTVTAAASSSGTGVDPLLCGNGKLDPGEPCDGADLAGKDCSSFGLAAGTLACSDHCTFFLAGCDKVEICDDGISNDFDLQVDCEDDDCAGAATCVDSCTPAKVLGLPDTIKSTTRGRPSVHEASCSGTSGNEAMYQITTLTAGKLLLDLTANSGPDFSLSVRTACDDDASEIACAVGGFAQTLAVDVVAGKTYFVMVDTVGVVAAGFQLDIHPWQPETACDNLVDDDDDGYVDCDDPTGCQGTAACAPGAGAAGTPCATSAECFANHDDPVCLPLNEGFPGGYCSEFCDLAAPDCAGDGVCAQLGLSASGVCLDGCATDADCRSGYLCKDLGNAEKACLAGPETDCADNLDNDGNGLRDCGDPSCQALPACVPGAAPAGDPCAANTDCFSGSNDPICFSEAAFNLPGGYCSELCVPGAGDCPAGAECVNFFQLSGGLGSCMHTCDVTTDCRPTYNCVDIGAPKKFCFL
jgi:hypothetical protein